MAPSRAQAKKTMKAQGLRKIFAAGVLLSGTILATTFGVHAADLEYKLGPQDKVRLKVFEWRATRDEVYEWAALNDEFVVGPGGKLSLPFVGEVAAAGLPTGEVARIVADRLRARLGMADRPDTTIEIVSFRPIYVAGYVGKPGEYSYRPGLSVIQAVTIAQGFQRLSGVRLEREIIAGRGDLKLLNADLRALQLRKARLESEFKMAGSIEFPPDSGAASDDNRRLIAEQEKLIFEARRRAFETQLDAFQQLKGYLEKEIASLNEQMQLEERQIDIIQKELQTVVSLVGKGYAAAPRQLGLERTLAQAEGDKLRLGSTIMKARQEISKTDIAILEIRNKRQNDVTVDLRETQSKIDALVHKLETAKGLLRETEEIAPEILGEQSNSARAVPSYTIFRTTEGRSIKIPADEGTLVQPGDTVHVQLSPDTTESARPVRRLADSPIADGSGAATR
jgi:protein involved in polysaccharide export with SLBB domain